MSTSEERLEFDAREIAIQASISALRAIQEINRLLPKVKPKDVVLHDALLDLKTMLFDSVKTLNEVRGK